MGKNTNKKEPGSFKKSLYIIFAFFSLASVSFFYIGKKTHNNKWTRKGFLYLILFLIPFVNIIAYFSGIVSVIKTRKEYLIRLKIENSLNEDIELREISKALKARKEYLIRNEIAATLEIEDEKNNELKETIYEDYGLIDYNLNRTVNQKTTHKTEQVLSENEYVRKIQGYIWKVNKTQVKVTLENIELVCINIFEYIQNHPESEYKIKPLTNYYLPELFSHIEKYIELQKNTQLNLPNIKAGMDKIESIIYIIGDACNNIYNQLFDDSLLDISNDIDVLKNYLRQNDLEQADKTSMFS